MARVDKIEGRGYIFPCLSHLHDSGGVAPRTGHQELGGRSLAGARFYKVGVTLRVTKAAKSGRWHSSLGE